jgi:hypothetical protein
MMPWEPARDIMRRTMVNLEFIELHATERHGPYEVTQLINPFLGALAHPWEKFRDGIDEMPLSSSEGWPRLPKELPADTEPNSVGEALRLLRNGIAHGNIDFLPGTDGTVSAVRIRNYNRGRRTWGTVLSVTDLRCFLTQFVRFIESIAEPEHDTQKRTA